MIWILFMKILCTADAQIAYDSFPGYQPYLTRPIIAKGLDLPLSPTNRLKGGVIYGQTNYIPPPPNEAFLPVNTGNGNYYLVPKVFYSKFNSAANFNSKLKTPDFTNPASLINNFISTGGQAEKQDNLLGGIYVPLPFGLQPLAFQLIDEAKKDRGGTVGLGLNHFKQPDPVVPPATNMLMRALDGAAQYIDQRRSSIPEEISSSQDDQEENGPPPPPRQNVLDKAFQGLSSPDFGRRLATNLMQVFAESGRNRTQINDNRINATLPNVGGYQDANNSTKSTGLYISIPFLPPSYLGGYVNNDRSDLVNFG